MEEDKRSNSQIQKNDNENVWVLFNNFLLNYEIYVYIFLLFIFLNNITFYKDQTKN